LRELLGGDWAESRENTQGTEEKPLGVTVQGKEVERNAKWGGKKKELLPALRKAQEVHLKDKENQETFPIIGREKTKVGGRKRDYKSRNGAFAEKVQKAFRKHWEPPSVEVETPRHSRYRQRPSKQVSKSSKKENRRGREGTSRAVKMYTDGIRRKTRKRKPLNGGSFREERAGDAVAELPVPPHTQLPVEH